MFETIVRPWQTPAPLATRRTVVANSTQVSVIPGHLAWGAVGALPTPTEETLDDGNLAFKVESCDDNYTEQSRKTTPLRIIGNDGESFIDFERIDSINFGRKASNKVVGAIRTQTTTFAAQDPFQGTAFGTVKTQDNCKSTFNLKNT